MRRHPTLLLGILLGMTLLASVNAEGEPGAFSVLANSTLSCSTAWPSATVGCFWERPILVLGDVEIAIGLDAQAVLLGNLVDAHLAPYLIAAAYLDTWSAWVELRMPDLAGVPVLGSSDWFRAGFSIRIPP